MIHRTAHVRGPHIEGLIYIYGYKRHNYNVVVAESYIGAHSDTSLFTHPLVTEGMGMGYLQIAKLLFIIEF